jgi:hypothetical protein
MTTGCLLSLLKLIRMDLSHSKAVVVPPVLQCKFVTTGHFLSIHYS